MQLIPQDVSVQFGTATSVTLAKSAQTPKVVNVSHWHRVAGSGHVKCGLKTDPVAALMIEASRASRSEFGTQIGPESDD